MDPEPSSLLVFLITLDLKLILGFILLLALLICSGLISGAEVALFSLTKSDLDETKENNSKPMQIVSKLLEKPKKLLATVLVANNFINLAIVLLFAYLGNFIFESIASSIVKFIIEVIIATFLILLFGEILPKIYASRNRIKFATLMAYPLKALDFIISPLSVPMQNITIALHSKLGRQKSNISVDQLSHALELTSEEDTSKQEQKILKGIVSFGNTETKQVMRPRIDIFALHEEDKYEDIIPEIVKHGYSRIPVYKENVDKIIGVLYVKDLLPHIDKKNFNWTTLLREPFFVPENKKLDDLMSEFQEKKVHLAIVVDEYGGTSGIVTLEDILEEIVGDISDEFDDEDLVYSKLDDLNYVFEGKTPLKDFYRVIKLEDESIFEDNRGEAETIAGFVLEIYGGFPKKNSKIKFENYVFNVESLDKKRIKRIKITIP